MTSAASATLLGVAHLATDPRSASAAATGRSSGPVPTLDRHAHRLHSTSPDHPEHDLWAFGHMVGSTPFVTMGEAAHGSREFTTLHQRLFYFLARNKGFATFAREMSWGTGVQLDAYVQDGTGDPREIMDRELETFYQVFDTDEFLELVESLRRHNRTHRRRLHIMGPDISFPSPSLFAEIDDYLAEHHPGRRRTVHRLYEGLRPDPGTHLTEFMATYVGAPLSERREHAHRSREALRLLHTLTPGGRTQRSRHSRVVQHARAIAQVAAGAAIDTTSPEGIARFGRYREAAMTDNLLWWHARTRDKMVMSTMNAHASYAAIDPGVVPRPLGSHLRERLGPRHLNVGMTFGRGWVNSLESMETPKEYGPHLLEAGTDSNEHTLDRVRHDRYFLDLRSIPRPARSWLTRRRPTFNVGGALEAGEDGRRSAALATSFDLLLHLDEVGPGTPRWD